MRNLILYGGIASLFLFGCSNEKHQNSTVFSSEECTLATKQIDADLQITRSSNLNQLSAMAEMLFGPNRISIGNSLAAAIHQSILMDGNAKANLTVDGTCTAFSIKDGTIVDKYFGYSAYSPSTIKAARNLHVEFKSNLLTSKETANRLFELYFGDATTGEQRSIEILNANGISADQIRAEFVTTSLANFDSKVFASSWDLLPRGLLIKNAMALDKLLSDPSDCEINFNDDLSPVDRLDRQTNCISQHQALRSKFFAGLYEIEIKSRTEIKVTRSLDGKKIISGSVEAKSISKAEIDEQTFDLINRIGMVSINY
jgi:hypothetical protein